MIAFVVTSITDERVLIDAHVGKGWRPVCVLRHDPALPPVWRSLEFPNVLTDAGRTLGSVELDHLATLKAFEALVIVDTVKKAASAA